MAFFQQTGGISYQIREKQETGEPRLLLLEFLPGERVKQG